MATCSSILAWRIPGAEEPGGLQSIRSDTSEVTEYTHTQGTKIPHAAWHSQKKKFKSTHISIFKSQRRKFNP